MSNINKHLILLLATSTLVACAQSGGTGSDPASEQKAEQTSTSEVKETTEDVVKHIEEELKEDVKKLEEEIKDDVKKAVEEIEKEVKEGIEGTAEKVKETVEKSAEDIGKKVKTYIVKAGDSLWSIAKDVLKDISLVDKLYEMNKDTIPNKDVIHPGQVLKLPETE